MLPIILDVKDKRAVVFGGGEVGLRKARFFASEAEVKVVSKTFVPGFERERGRMDLVTEDLMSTYHDRIVWADFVIIATEDRSINDMLEAEAAKKGKYCNRADGISSFLIPSVVERDNFIVAISTLGRSPGMSRYLREHIDDMLGPEYSAMVELQESLREMAKSRYPDQGDRERRLWSVLDDDLVWAALASDPVKAKEMALRTMEGSDVHHT